MARVLIVDDAAFMRKMLGDVLAKGGHEVIGEGANGVEAITQFQSLRPDIMTLDITMPEKDGLAALREILTIEPGAKIVMCSALGQESKVLEAIKSGAKDFVVKPFQPDRVLDAIGKALGVGVQNPPNAPNTILNRKDPAPITRAGLRLSQSPKPRPARIRTLNHI